MGLTLDQEVDHGAEVVDNLVFVGWSKRLFEVVRSKSRRTSAGVFAEGGQSNSNIVSAGKRGQPHIGKAQTGQVQGIGRQRVFSTHFFKRRVRVQEAGTAQGLAGLGVRALTAKTVAPELGQGLVDNRIVSPLALARNPDRGEVLPKASTLAIQPPFKPRPSEGNPLVGVLRAGPGWRTEHTLGKHLRLGPVRRVVVEGGRGDRHRKAAGPK